MCGILALMYKQNNNHIDVDRFHTALNLLKHRGPDHSCIKAIDNVLIGHTRLAILDTDQRSNQPFEYDKYIMVFNGEIYNYLELKSLLIELGYSFSTNGDTEVVIKAFHQWGQECFSKFNGDWALVIYDKSDQSIIVCRDRFAVKPLFYYENKYCICFSSEITPITELFNLNEDFDVIGSFIIDGGSVEQRTFFKDVNEFPSSSFAIYKNGDLIKHGKYWEYPKLNNSFGKEKSEDFIDLLRDAVALRLRTDVDYCMLLSGGIDSSIISAIISEHNRGRNTMAFNFSSEDKDDENVYAKEIAADLNFELKTFNLTSDYFNFKNDLTDLIRCLGRGHSSPAILSVNELYKGISSNGYKVALDGQGADELLGGYSHYHYSALFTSLIRGKLFFAFRFAIEIIYNFRSITIMWLKLISNNYILEKMVTIYGYQKFFKNKYNRRNNKDTKSTIWNLKEYVFKQHKTGLRNLLYYGDIVAMKNSVENRSPFMDYRLVEFVAKEPLNLIVEPGSNKNVLRKSSYYFRFKSILDRKKVGFNTPISNHIKLSMIEELKDSRIINWDIFNVDKLKKSLDSGVFISNKYERFLFRLYQCHLWDQVFFRR